MKGMKLLTKEQQESNKNSTICYICKEKIENKVWDHYGVPKKLLWLFIVGLTMVIVLS